jgi:hypothetical protein
MSRNLGKETRRIASVWAKQPIPFKIYPSPAPMPLPRDVLFPKIWDRSPAQPRFLPSGS